MIGSCSLARGLIASLAVCGLTLSGLASDVEEPDGDLATLQGTWSCTILDTLPLTLVIDGERGTLRVTFPGGEVVTYKGKVVLDESAEPKHLDFVDYRGPDGEELPDNPGIYRLDGDRLILCNRTRDGERPERFGFGDDGYPLLQVYSRVDPQDR